jgi:hypothetical protein
VRILRPNVTKLVAVTFIESFWRLTQAPTVVSACLAIGGRNDPAKCEATSQVGSALPPAARQAEWTFGGCRKSIRN